MPLACNHHRRNRFPKLLCFASIGFMLADIRIGARVLGEKSNYVKDYIRPFSLYIIYAKFIISMQFRYYRLDSLHAFKRCSNFAASSEANVKSLDLIDMILDSKIII
jgi:hypothetical protein